MLGFARFFGDFVDLQVFEEVDPKLARYCEVDVAVFVEVLGDDLGTDTCGAVVGEWDAGEGCITVDFVAIDYVGIVGARVISGVAAIALAGDRDMWSRLRRGRRV